MLPSKCYCFNVAKINAAISLERVKNETDIVKKLYGIGSIGVVFTAESLIRIVKSYVPALLNSAI